MENNEFTKVCTCYYFDGRTKLEDFDLDHKFIRGKII